MDESGFLACTASPTHQIGASKSAKLSQSVTTFSFRPIKIHQAKKRRFNNVFF